MAVFKNFPQNGYTENGVTLPLRCFANQASNYNKPIWRALFDGNPYAADTSSGYSVVTYTIVGNSWIPIEATWGTNPFSGTICHNNENEFTYDSGGGQGGSVSSDLETVVYSFLAFGLFVFVLAVLYKSIIRRLLP